MHIRKATSYYLHSIINLIQCLYCNLIVLYRILKTKVYLVFLYIITVPVQYDSAEREFVAGMHACMSTSRPS